MKFARFADLPNGAVARSRHGTPLHKVRDERNWYPGTERWDGIYSAPSPEIDRVHAPWTLVWVTEDPIEAYLMTGGE